MLVLHSAVKWAVVTAARTADRLVAYWAALRAVRMVAH